MYVYLYLCIYIYMYIYIYIYVYVHTLRLLTQHNQTNRAAGPLRGLKKTPTSRRSVFRLRGPRSRRCTKQNGARNTTKTHIHTHTADQSEVNKNTNTHRRQRSKNKSTEARRGTCGSTSTWTSSGSSTWTSSRSSGGRRRGRAELALSSFFGCSDSMIWRNSGEVLVHLMKFQ